MSGEVYKGTAYNLALVAARSLTGAPVEPRYIYVFVLDKHGGSTILVPVEGHGDVENRYPRPSDAKPRGVYCLWPESFAMVGPPYGTDTYFVLATRTKIPNVQDVLSWQAVRSRGGAPGGAMDPLSNLLYNVGTSTRGGSAPAPTTWSVGRLTVKSRSGPAGPTGSPGD